MRPFFPTAALSTVLALTVGAYAGEKASVHLFDKADVGQVPKGWKADQTGKGEGSLWKVVEDRTGPGKTGYVLAQTAKSPSALFNLCVLHGKKFKDVDVKVAFKAVRGDVDQGGGIVWRYQDASNYYVARMNPLEDNYRVYKVVAGKRIQLGTREGVKVPAGEWHHLHIRMVGSKIECSLDAKKLLEATDDTIAEAGLVGLWSKADAQSSFDAFAVMVLKE
jgi:Domain of Unknown Function (DUF1080)